MRIDHVWSKHCRGLIGAAIVALALVPAAEVLAEEPLTIEEVVLELVDLTPKLTPLTVKYDKESKTLIFNEVVESSDKSVNGRIGELRARLERMDSKRIHYQAGHAKMTLLIRGKPIAGQVFFHCQTNARCVSRGFNDSIAPDSVSETNDEKFAVDIFDDSITYNQLHRFGDLIRHLIIVANR